MRTTLTTDTGTTSGLFGRGHHPAPRSPRAPSPPTSAAARYTFPVTTGRVDAKTLGRLHPPLRRLLLAQREAGAWKALSLTKFTIHITGAPYLTAVVNGGHAGRDRRPRPRQRQDQDVHQGTAAPIAAVKNVGVTLNATAMGAVNSTFGTALPDNVKLGTADVLARVAH